MRIGNRSLTTWNPKGHFATVCLIPAHGHAKPRGEAQHNHKGAPWMVDASAQRAPVWKSHRILRSVTCTPAVLWSHKSARVPNPAWPKAGYSARGDRSTACNHSFACAHGLGCGDQTSTNVCSQPEFVRDEISNVQGITRRCGDT